jgi:predicted RNase H-like HicB family nuclease
MPSLARWGLPFRNRDDTIFNSQLAQTRIGHSLKEKRMSELRQLTAVIEREGDGYAATCPELDIVSQGNSVEEARMNLLEAVEGFLEVASPSEIKHRWKTETYITSIVQAIPPGKAIGVAS